jgi:hypothetical protein
LPESPTLKRYLALFRRMEIVSKGFTIEYIDRNKNAEADELAKEAARNTPLPADIFLQIISVIKCIYLPPTYLHFIQDIVDRCLLLMSSTSFVDLPF